MTNLVIPGPVGDIEAIVESPRDNTDANIMAIVCHPHPQYDGTMTNKVVVTVARALRKMGCTTVRFNYRGVGKSAGAYDNAVGEVDDLMAVVNFARTHHRAKQLWLAGFSFGAYIAAKGATQVGDVKQLISIAPSVENMDYQSLSDITIPWLVVQGDQDEVVSAPAVFDYVDSLANPPTLIKMPGVGHFFHSKLIDLEQVLLDQLDQSTKHN